MRCEYCTTNTTDFPAGMRALRKTARGPGHIRVEHIAVPDPGPGDALIRVHFAGVCGTDVHIYHDRFASSPPLTLGHEFSGVVVDTGEEVRNVGVGDRVVSANNPRACGTCKVCSLGLPNLCEHKRAMGIHSDGAFADYVLLEADLLHRIPDGVELEAAALAEPLAVATHTLRTRTRIAPGDTVLVLGPGAIGLLCAQVARAEGAAWTAVLGTDLDEEIRLPLARSLGFEALNAQAQDPATWTRDRTDGVGVDVVIEAAGSSAAVETAVRCVRRAGRIGAFGITGQEQIPVAWDELVSRAVSVHFCYSSIHEDWRRSLEYLANGSVHTGPLITHRYELENWRDAFTALERQEAVRPVLRIAPREERTS